MVFEWFFGWFLTHFGCSTPFHSISQTGRAPGEAQGQLCPALDVLEMPIGGFGGAQPRPPPHPEGFLHTLHPLRDGSCPIFTNCKVPHHFRGARPWPPSPHGGPCSISVPLGLFPPPPHEGPCIISVAMEMPVSSPPPMGGVRGVPPSPWRYPHLIFPPPPQMESPCGSFLTPELSVPHPRRPMGLPAASPAPQRCPCSVSTIPWGH